MKKKKTIKRIRKPATRSKKRSNLLGKVTHYFDKINVAVVKLSQPLKVGNYVEFRHDDESFNQVVESMQVNHKQIPAARKGLEIGLKVPQKIKEGWVMLKAKQPSLLSSIPKKEEVKEFKPIFPKAVLSDKPAIKPFISPAARPLPPVRPAVTEPPPKPQQKKSGYEGISFFKF